MTSPQGYLSYPLFVTHPAKALYVVSGHTLWVSENQQTAYRLFSQDAIFKSLCVSPSQDWLAYSILSGGKEDVYLWQRSSGIQERLTYVGGATRPVLWEDEDTLWIASDRKSPFAGLTSLYRLSRSTKQIEDTPLPFGPVTNVTRGSQGRLVLQRDGYGYESWKSYRGGMQGQLWIQQNDDSFQKFLDLEGNQWSPFWSGDWIYFLSDHGDSQALYRTCPQGKEIQKVASHPDFFIQHFSLNQNTLFYTAGGKLYSKTIHESNEQDLAQPLFLQMQGGPTQNLNPVYPIQNHLQSFTLHPQGRQILLHARGQMIHMTCQQGWVKQHGEPSNMRYTMSTFVGEKGMEWMSVKDTGLTHILELHSSETDQIKSFAHDFGRILGIKAMGSQPEVLLINHRHELLRFHYETELLEKIDQAPCHGYHGWDVSPDGLWLVYSLSVSRTCSVIRLYNTETKTITPLTQPILEDKCPRFDPDGKGVVFLSNRLLENPGEPLNIQASFRLFRVFMVLFQDHVYAPFYQPALQALTSKEEEEEESETSSSVHPCVSETPENQLDEKSHEQSNDIGTPNKKNKPWDIQLCNIASRIHGLPLSSDHYLDLLALKGKVLLLIANHGSYDEDSTEEVETTHVDVFEYGHHKREALFSDVMDWVLSSDGQWLAYQNSHKRLRVIKAGEKPDDSDTSVITGGGWIDLQRAYLIVDKRSEWKHMFDEAWSLQKEFFWDHQRLATLDWQAIYQRYRALMDDVSSYQEWISVIREMQGELRTSHAYIYPTGLPSSKERYMSLGIDAVFCPEEKAYRILHIDSGYSWDQQAMSPLRLPGIQLMEGDWILAINGQMASAHQPLESFLLCSQPKMSLTLTAKRAKTQEIKDYVVFPNKSRLKACYYQWIEKNRQYVFEASEGRLGYLHAPDMSVMGLMEFYRSYAQIYDKEGLILDLRFNGGGFVSPYLLDLLRRVRLGIDRSRWESDLSYMDYAPKGPMVTLCNGWTGSDGDMFCHAFQSLGLGPLIGTQTWGGVVGISPRNPLVDGTVTTQPEYSAWFKDVAWGLENRGAIPDIWVDITPEDWKAQRDPQLERGVQEVLQTVAIHMNHRPN